MSTIRIFSLSLADCSRKTTMQLDGSRDLDSADYSPCIGGNPPARMGELLIELGLAAVGKRDAVYFEFVKHLELGASRRTLFSRRSRGSAGRLLISIGR